MKKHTFRRAAAVAAACVMMAAAMPVIPGTATAEGNLIKNSTFDTNASGWDLYKETGGVCTMKAEDGKLGVTVVKQGKVSYSCQLFYDIIKLYQNGKYRMSFEISSTIPRVVEAMIQLNGGDYHSYVWKKIEVLEEPQKVEFEFTMKDPTDIMSKLCFNLGIEEEDGEMPTHTVYFDNVELELIDDSEVDYSDGKPYEPGIITNQVGFGIDSVKTAVFRCEGGEYSIVDAATDKVVYTGKLDNYTEDKLAGESVSIGDFSDFKTPGAYYIKAEGLDDSYQFRIGDNAYGKLFDDTIRMLYLQRCGCEVEDEKFGHPVCHDSKATIYHTTKKIDVSGGWHDAGDYGRYVVPAAKAVADLMYAYLDEPEIFSDKIGIPESGNGIPDVLDEVRYELEWMMKMQDAEDGGVHHKVSCATFPGFIMPEKENGELIVMPKTVTASADHAAAMALAAEVYKDIDPEFAAKCLESAGSAYTWAAANPKELYIANPDDISTGAYEDEKADDELYWAAAQLYRATGDEKYLDGIAVKTGLDWAVVGDYGNIAILTMDGADKESALYKDAYKSIIEQADEFVENSAATNYGVALKKFNWGSNMTVANAGIVLSMAYKLTGEQAYMDAAEKQLNYLMGHNANGACFVTGYGTVSPQKPHHRPSVYVNEAMVGMLVGGVNSGLEDSAAKAYLVDNAPAKCWVDHDQSYSTNEITIYWNSPLTYLMAMTDSVKPAGDEVLPGDANEDGKVTIADAAAVIQYLGNKDKYPLSDKGMEQADVYQPGSGITTNDALTIQQYVAKLLPGLPIVGIPE